MDGQDTLFFLFGIKWTLPMVGGFMVGSLTAIGTLYKIIELWMTREARRLAMLREYLDKEECDISGRRPVVLESIRMSEHSYLSDKKFDVGAEIDIAIDLLDRGYPQAACGKLSELERRLESNERFLRQRSDHLQKHAASVHIFLAALADRDNKADLGLDYIGKALGEDPSDLDALKYQGLLLLDKGDLVAAERSFDKLRVKSNGAHNASYRADAHLGLGTVSIKRGVARFEDAMRSLANALQNATSVPAAKYDHYMLAQIYRLQGDMHKTAGWSGTDPTNAKTRACYENALNSLNQIAKRRNVVDSELKTLRNDLEELRPSA
jgi:tetratricopeptide (TPR) repeat protein